MKYINIILVIISIFYAPLTNANHLKGKSDFQALGMHKFRSNVLVNRFQTEIISPAKKPEMIKDTSKPNSVIRNIIDQSDLLSVLFYDGNSITLNELSTTKLEPLEKMYSMSISKSYVGYLLGHAICDGFIKTLDDSIGQYVPETSGTIYEEVSLQNMINMTAGDGDHWERGSNNMFVYATPILRGKKTIKDLLEESRGVSPDEKPNFYYSNIVPDLVARAVHLKSPAGMKDYFYKKIAKTSGNSSEIIYLKDKNDWGIHFAFYYATRGDYLKFAKLIAQDWKSNSCIGSYLKKLYENRVPTGKPENGSHNFQSYGGFFWMDKPNFDFPHFVMNGHGGQRVIINFKTGAILSMHSIRDNFNQTEVEELLLE
jgi:CubicO group peptidase (beta-lactamase class C family)